MPFDGTQNPTVRVLETVKAYIHKHGWCQFALQDNRGRVCLTGGFLYSGVSEHPEGQAAFTLLDTQARITTLSVAHWNNAPGRTVEDVYKLIDDTIQTVLSEEMVDHFFATFKETVTV